MAEPTVAELMAKLAELQKENATLTRKASSATANGLSMRASEKGGVSIYGVGRFPVTLYPSQAVNLGKAMFGAKPGCELYKFINANVDKLSFKDDEQKAAVLAELQEQDDLE